MNKECLTCKKLFPKKVKESKTEWQKKKYCSYLCYWESKIGHIPWNKGKEAPQISKALKGRVLSIEWRNKISASNTGKKQSPETIEKRTENNRRENHYEWKGDNVGYGALHSWVQKELGYPEACEHCEKKGLSGHKIHWANKTGKYLRKHSDWLRLCVSCHRKYDHKNKITMAKFQILYD